MKANFNILSIVEPLINGRMSSPTIKTLRERIKRARNGQAIKRMRNRGFGCPN